MISILEEKILVSVYCLCYNHANYIRDTLEGFIKQETTFNYEVIIHDDASSDESPEIIKEYSELYPNLIRPIFQTENQYSKKISISETFIFPVVRGKYIALCEGDDYWIDSKKLQRQIDYMERNPKCSLSFHNAIVVNPKGEYVRPFFPANPVYKKYFKNNTGIYTTEEMILLDFVPTNSLIYRFENTMDLPAYFKNGVCGDLPIRLFHTSKGYAYYFNEVMSAYRIGVSGSANERSKQSSDKQKQVMMTHKWILNEFDKSTDYSFTRQIQDAKKIKEFLYYYGVGDKSVLMKEYRKLFYEFSLISNIKFFCRVYCKGIYRSLKIVQKKVRKY